MHDHGAQAAARRCDPLSSAVAVSVTVVPRLRLAIRDDLPRGAGAAALRLDLQERQASQDSGDRHAILNQLPIEEGRCAPAGGCEWVEKLAEGPAGSSEHRQAGMLQLRLTHPLEAGCALLGGHGLEMGLAILGPDKGLQPIGLRIRKCDEGPRVEANVALARRKGGHAAFIE